MYSVSNSYKSAALQPVQEHRLTGTIGSVSFDENNIISGTFNIQKQCTDTSDVVLGSAYIGQLTATFTGVNIARGAWLKKNIAPSFALKVGNSWETVPLGIFKIKEANHTAEGVEVVAYDNMAKFDKVIKKKKQTLGFATDSMYTFISLACTKCNVTLGMTQAQIEALPNGHSSVDDIEIYGDVKDTDFANDIETYRDLIFWCAQTMGCYATIDRQGQLVFKQYTQNVVDDISDQIRLSGAAFEDYTTHYTGIYFTDMDTNDDTYYGYDVEQLIAQLNETASDISDTEEDISDNTAALADLEERHNQGQITDEEYIAEKAVLDAEAKALNIQLKKLTKRLAWLEDALQKAQADDDGATMDCGANPFLQYENLTKRDNRRRHVLAALDDISYTPFTCSLICGAHYDLGDVIRFSGGHSDNDICCVMMWSYTHNQGTEIQGFGTDTNEVAVRIKNRARKEAKAAGSTAANTGHTYVAENDPDTETGAPRSGKSGDIWIKTTQPHIADIVTKDYPVYKLFDVQNSPNSRYSYATMSITCIHGNFIMVAVNNFSGYNPAYTGDILRNYYSIYPICRVPKGTPIDSVLSSCFSVEQSDLNYYNYEDGTPGWPPTEFGCFADDIQDTIRIFGQRQLSNNFDYYHALFGAGTYKGGMRAFKEPDIGNGVDYFFETEEALITALYNDELEFPDIYEGEYTNNIKYNDNGEWKDVDYISKVDKSADAGGETWNGLQVSEENKKLSLKKNVMRAWYKADPPQTQRNFSQFCVRYTGEPDSDIEIESYADHTWANIDIKADDENAYKIKCGGVGGSGKYCVYKITGLTSGEKYYFNFAVNFSNGATFGNNTSKGLGLVFNTTGSINSDDWSGAEDTFDETTLYYSMRRTKNKNYADFSFTATASTMYMCVVTADITSSSSINLVLSEFVVSKSERKLIRNIYLYDYEKDVWLKYRPFGSIAGSEGGEGSVVTITPTLQTGVKVADYSIDGESGEIYAPQGGVTIDELNDIGDVNISNPSEGQVLKYDATNEEWVNDDESGGASALVDLTDVDFENQSDGQIIEYDGESGKWVNVTPTIPSINGVQLVGNKTTSDLGIFITLTQSEYDALTTEEKEDLRIFYFVTDDEPEPPAPTYLYTGTFISASTSQGKVDIDCGFEPNYILVVLPFGNGNTYAIYAEMLSTTISKWWIPMERNKYDIIIGSETGETGINDILSNGFKFRSNGGNTQGVNCQVSARLLNNTNSLSGIFTTSNVVDGVVDVSCGFRPAYIFVILPFNQSSLTYAIYEEEISDTTSLWMIDAERNLYTLTIGAASGETGICDITNDGFKFRSHGRNTLNISCTFIACE